MSKGRTLSQLISAGAVLADGQISASEIVGMVSVLKVTATTYPGDDLAANPSGGQTITLTGSNFISTPTVYVGDTIAPSVTFVSATQLTFTAPAKTAGTYSVYVVNPDGTTAILVNGISYSGTPAWTTPAGSLGSVDANFTIQLQAAGDAPVTYSLTTGSTLPSGVTLSSAGRITGTAIGSDQTFSFSVDAIDAQRQETPRSFQVTVVLADPFFRYVTLLLQADPVITPFNSDASTNAFNLTLNGDVRSDNFTPYQGDGYYSNYFNGSSGIRFPDNAAFSLGTNPFTVEGWFNIPSMPGNDSSIISKWVNGNDSNSAWMIDFQSGNLSAAISIGGTVTRVTGSSGVPLNTWNHFALVRSGSPGTLSLFLNGTRIATATPTGSIVDDTNSLGIGIRGGTDGFHVTAHISNIRVVNGTDLYGATNTSITVPTSFLTAVTNTALLTCRSNRFIDSSSNNFTATLYSVPRVSLAQPFTLPTTSATYGSGYFNGSTSYLNVASNAVFGFGTGDFTVEFFIFPTATANTWSIYHGSIQDSFIINTNSSGNLVIRQYNVADLFTSASALTVGAWNHVAVARSGTTISLWLNGSRANGVTGTNSSNFVTSGVFIGRADSVVGWVQGYMTDVRTVKGTAVYNPSSTTITVPTAPLTAVSGTSLLTTQYNGAGNNNTFVDSSTNNFVITRNGNTTQGTFSPYGSNWSNYFDGSGDYLTVASNSAFYLSTGNFTVEAWVYKNVSGTKIIVGQTQNNSAPYNGWLLYVNSSNFATFEGSNGVAVTATTSFPLNQWVHVAAVRSSSTTTLYVNGTSVATGTVSITDFNGSLNIGQYTTPISGTEWNGYISNLRIVKGTAVYTSAFTPSTTPLTAITNTSLLTCADNRFIDDSTNNFTITRNGDVSIQSFSPFSPTTAYSTSVIGGSGYFDGSVDRLSIAGNSAFDVSSGNFTVEGWVYPTSNANVQGLFVLFTATNANYGGMTFYVSRNTNNTITFECASPSIGGGSPAVAITTTNTVPINAWSHVSATRSGNTFTVWINGVSSGTATFSGTLYWSPPNLYLGSGNDSTANSFTGYISNFRLVKGTAVYTAAFTPPSSPATAISGTQVLTNFTNAGILDNTMMNDLETVGNAQISTSVKKYGTGSMYFDGAGDGLYRPSSDLFNFGSGSFTIEFWMYFSSKTGYQTLASYGYSPLVATGWLVQTGNGDGKLIFYRTNAGSATVVATDAGSTVNTGQWYHIAVVKNGSTTTIYRDGTSVGSGSDTNTYLASANFYIGGGSNTGFDGFYFNGYIDDLRITKGVARYTANFTPPTLAFKAR